MQKITQKVNPTSTKKEVKFILCAKIMEINTIQSYYLFIQCTNVKTDHTTTYFTITDITEFAHLKGDEMKEEGLKIHADPSWSFPFLKIMQCKQYAS